MLTVGASNTRDALVRASAPIVRPTRSTRSTFQVAPSAEPHGAHHDVVAASVPGRAGPGAALGPAVTNTLTIPACSTATVDHRSSPARSAAFSSRVSDATSASTSRVTAALGELGGNAVVGARKLQQRRELRALELGRSRDVVALS